jgi:hypothetical protein
VTKSQIFPGRYSARIEGSFVVFRLGMRVNSYFSFWKWLPTLGVLTPVLRTLLRSRPPGLLGSFSLFYLSAGRGIVQYWRTFEDLEAFARSKESPFHELWRRYRQSPGADGTVGLWYEAFLVDPDYYESVYDNMPLAGLARASQHIPAVGRLETARRRLGGQGEPALPSPMPKHQYSPGE